MKNVVQPEQHSLLSQTSHIVRCAHLMKHLILSVSNLNATAPQKP